MFTSTTIGIAIVVLAVLVGVVLWLRRGAPSEPPATLEKPRAELGEGKRASDAKTEPAREPERVAAKPEAKPEPKPEPKVETKVDAAKPATPAAAEPAAPIEAGAAQATEPEPAAQIPTRAEAVEPPPRRASVRPPGGVEDIAALKKGLASTRGGFIARLAKMLSRKQAIDPALIDQMEEVLLSADLGPKTTQKVLDRLRERMARNELANEDQVWDALRQEALSILGSGGGGIRLTKKPLVVLVVGVNGVGKTTTIGKLASRYKQDGKKVVLAAGDTFRAAAVLQLDVWGRRVGCPVVKGKDSADPGSVIFDAIKRAQADGADVVLADTAGRLHTKVPLMDELKKLGRTVEKALDRPADEVLLVLDATNGQNAIQQAQTFKEALGVTGIVLTKLDGTAKGGVVLGIVDEHGLPVRYVGIGERVEDLREFDAASFVQALFEKPEEEAEPS
jgi:fused signal recognition particle receptor